FNVFYEIFALSYQVNADRDSKLDMLRVLFHQKIDNPINPDNKKVIIFSAFADTAKYLYDQLADDLKREGLHTALVVGSGNNKTTLEGVRTKDINDVLVNFSPASKERGKLNGEQEKER